MKHLKPIIERHRPDRSFPEDIYTVILGPMSAEKGLLTLPAY